MHPREALGSSLWSGSHSSLRGPAVGPQPLNSALAFIRAASRNSALGQIRCRALSSGRQKSIQCRPSRDLQEQWDTNSLTHRNDVKQISFARVTQAFLQSSALSSRVSSLAVLFARGSCGEASLHSSLGQEGERPGKETHLAFEYQVFKMQQTVLLLTEGRNTFIKRCH